MPTAYIRHLSSQGKGSIPELENKWDRAKALAEEQGHKDNYAYITKIFQNLAGVEVDAGEEGPFLGAADRLMATRGDS